MLMKTNLDELDIAINLDAHCTDEFFEKIQNSVEKTFQFLYVVLVLHDRKDLIEKHKSKINFKNIDKMSYAMWQAFGDHFDFLCKLKEKYYFNFI